MDIERGTFLNPTTLLARELKPTRFLIGTEKSAARNFSWMLSAIYLDGISHDRGLPSTIVPKPLALFSNKPISATGPVNLPFENSQWVEGCLPPASPTGHTGSRPDDNIPAHASCFPFGGACLAIA